MAEHNDTGRWGERKAAEYLERKGYRILWKDWRDGHRDIDIVAVDADQLVVVEVKTRRSGSFMPPELAVDARKMRGHRGDKVCRHVPHRFSAAFRHCGRYGDD